MYSYNHLFYRQSPFFLQCVCLVCNRLLRHSFPFSCFFQFLTKFNHRSAISSVIHFIRAHILSAGHIRKASAPNTYDIIPREEWEVIEDCHEAIVTPEKWEQCRKSLTAANHYEGNACPFYNLFHGLVYMCHLRKSMQVRYEKVGRTGKNRFTARCGSR